MIDIVCTNAHEPTDQEIVSFFEMLSSPAQTKWDYEENQSYLRMSSAERIKFYREKLHRRSNRNHGFWAVDSGRVVGMAGINQFSDSFREHCADLGFGVAETHQREGVGYRLVCAAIEKARQLGLKRIESDCLTDNHPAIALLRKAGFKEEGLRRNAISKAGQLRDIRLFGLLL